MNKIRVTGILILILGIALMYFFDNTYGFLFGLLTGVGLAITITGRIGSSKG